MRSDKGLFIIIHMKNITFLLLVMLTAISCSGEKMANVTVSNGTEFDRNNEIVEVSMEEVSAKLQLPDTADLVIFDETDRQVPYQTTYDGKLIFPASVKANRQSTYFIKVGTPEVVSVKACGRLYPERLDDLAWENDRVAFRTYGPAFQAKGERGYGYDVWTKNVEEPVVDARYKNELNAEVRAKIAVLKEEGKADEAKALADSISYHVDHGNGMDCYNVGPTLGGGTSAFYVDDRIIYPYSFKTQEILDNGPLRFTARLTYNPLTVKGDTNVVETRLISLDEGSQLNKTIITYSNTNEVLPLATGLVIHEADGGTNVANAAKGYIGYADPTGDANAGNGIIYVGAVFPATIKEAKPVMFSDKEAKDSGAFGHLLAISDYAPGSEYVYYWGSGWSKYGFESMEAWTAYLDEYAQKVREPLKITVR